MKGPIVRRVPNQHSHLWNDLPDAERHRLYPFLIENHILHLEQTRAEVVAGHEQTLGRIDAQIKNLKSDLSR